MKGNPQKEFIEHCREWLADYHYHQAKAKELYQLAHDNEPVKHKKKNAGTRAGNLYLLGELKKVHAENWRADKDGSKPKQKQIPRQALTQEQRQQYTAKPTTGFLDKLINEVDEKRKAR